MLNPLDQWTTKLSDQNRIHIANQIIFEYKFAPTQKYDSLFEFLDQSWRHSDPQIKPWNHYVLGEVEKGHSNYYFSLLHLDSAITYARSPILYLKSHLSKAKVYTVTNELDTAFIHYQIALSGAKRGDFKIIQAEIFAALGEFYRKTDEYDKALTYLDSAQSLVDEFKIYGEINIDILDRKAALFSALAKIDSIPKLSYKALAIAIDQENVHAQAVSHNELGYYYENIEIVDSAMYHYNKAIEIWKTTKAYRYLINVIFNKSRMLIKIGNHNEAQEFLLISEILAQQNEFVDLLPEIYSHLSLIQYIKGNKEEELEYKIKELSAINKSTIIQNERKIKEIDFKHTREKNQRIIQDQLKKLELKEENIVLARKKNNQLYFFLLVFGVFVILLSILLVRSRANARELASLNNNLHIANNQKDVLLKEVHHRVKNNFQMISSLLNLQSRRIDDERVKGELREAQSRIYSMSLIHQKLYYGESYDHVNIKDFVNDILSALVHSDMRYQDIFKIDSKELFLHIEQAIPLGTIIHELATNSLKHAWNGNEDQSKMILLQFNKTGELFEFNYRDNGKGLPHNFTLDSSNSLGTRLIDLFVNRQLNGKVNYFNDQGSVFEISFKLRNEHLN